MQTMFSAPAKKLFSQYVDLVSGIALRDHVLMAR